MATKISAIFLMTILLASVASFSSPFNVVYADQDDKQEKKEEKLKEKEARLAEKQAKLAAKQNDDDDEEDIEEFGDDVYIDYSSKTTEICHIPPGNPSKNHTISVGTPAVPAHLAHHDKIGSCDDVDEPITDVMSFLAKKQVRLAEKSAEKEEKALQRAEKLLEKLEERIAKLEQRLQKLLEKVESGEYYGNLQNEDTVTSTFNISFDGEATSIYDDQVTAALSGEIFIENLVTASDVTKFKVTSGEIIVGNNVYDIIFGKARTLVDSNSLVLILQTLDSAENENTVKLTLNLDSQLDVDMTEPVGFEIEEKSKISEEWFLSGSGNVSSS
ncbi:MAG: hypothetical protein ACE5RJ_01500 [Nitrosopumilaceae archaeon]